MWKTFSFVIAVFLLSGSASVLNLSAEDQDAMLEIIQRVYPRLSSSDSKKILKVLIERARFLEESDELDYVNSNPPICEPLPIPPNTTNVGSLHPGNVRIVAAMGDSITAGFGASSKSLLDLKEFRGLSGSIGGDEGKMTFPNMLKQFSPKLFGFSTGTGDRENPTNFLNAAVSGAVVQDMPDQVDWLFEKIRSLGDDAFFNQWKVVSILIGGNNLCDYCRDRSFNSADSYELYLSQALQKLSTIPKTFVNLIPNLDITELHKFETGLCGILHIFECACATATEQSRQEVKAAGLEYTNRLWRLADNWKNKEDDFAVIVQPFLINSQIPDSSYLSSADCFHPSAKAHEAFGVALWNSIITPSDQKRYDWSLGEVVQCPTESTLFRID